VLFRADPNPELHRRCLLDEVSDSSALDSVDRVRMSFPADSLERARPARTAATPAYRARTPRTAEFDRDSGGRTVGIDSRLAASDSVARSPPPARRLESLWPL
jgi:hypothetical protein